MSTISGEITALSMETGKAVTELSAATYQALSAGVETASADLYAKEAELTAIRTILAGRRAGLDGAVIRERLRETYV